MMQWLVVAFGGALGAMARYGVGLWLAPVSGRFPYATLSCNLLGSFLMGICFVLIVERSVLSPESRLLFMVGGLGAFTTFSTFSLETVTMLTQGHVMSALIYILLSVGLCAVALYGGLWLARLF